MPAVNIFFAGISRFIPDSRVECDSDENFELFVNRRNGLPLSRRRPIKSMAPSIGVSPLTRTPSISIRNAFAEFKFGNSRTPERRDS